MDYDDSSVFGTQSLSQGSTTTSGNPNVQAVRNSLFTAERIGRKARLIGKAPGPQQRNLPMKSIIFELSRFEWYNDIWFLQIP